MEDQAPNTKQNVNKFDDDVQRTGSYAYTTERLSSQLSNRRISDAIATSYSFAGKRVLDLGCGDGTYTLEFPNHGVREIVGIDPAAVAIQAAAASAEERGLSAVVAFHAGNIYDLQSVVDLGQYDCIVLRGVLHHLPDAARAIGSLTGFVGTIIIVEPNGMNPVLKLLERFSKYHVEHEERSFTSSKITSWLSAAGFRTEATRVINLVPFFCPDWMANGLRKVEPIVERLPLVRTVACGQTVIVAARS